jgi:uncharacterized membrane protein
MARKGTTHSDVPPATAKNPNPAAEFVTATSDDVLVARSVTINRSAQDLYDFWRDFRN